MKYSITCFLALLILLAEASAQTGSSLTVTVRGSVTDKSTRSPLPARVVIRDSAGTVYHSFYNKLPGFFTQQDGTFELKLPPGSYDINVYRGIDYLSVDSTFIVQKNIPLNLFFGLDQWVPLKEKGWVNGDGHDHLYTDVKHDSLMLDTMRRIFLAQGIDFICTAQGWAGYDDSTWRRGYAPYNDTKLMVHYGSEMPKYRTGHTWWLGQTTTEGIYWNTMDTTYENSYYQSEQGTSWTFDSLKFPQVPDIEIVQRFKKRDNAVAVIAHPTSWWWQKRGNIEKYVTNVAAYLPLGLLAGKIWEGQVIMGYDRDHYFYQNLWFGVLNEGYKMTPVSELDGGYNRGDKFYYGSMRTYYKIDGAVTIDKIKQSVRAGKTFVTSGPIVFANIDNKYTYGDVVPANGRQTLTIDAYASGDAEDFISYIVLFRNGSIHRLWDMRKEKQRRSIRTVTLNEKENSWYVIKVYGKNAWQDTAALDVIKYCTKNFKLAHDSIGTESDVAITSPFYFRNPGVSEPAPLMSNIDLTVSDAEGQSTNDNVKAEIFVSGKLIRTINLIKGNGKFRMPVHGIIKLSKKGMSPIYRTLYLDYLPARNIIEQLASGRWLTTDTTKQYNPGEVPWSAFQFSKMKTELSNVSWNIHFAPNERDPLWAPLNAVFGGQ